MDVLNPDYALKAETRKISKFLGLKVSNEQISNISSQLTKKAVRDLISNQLKIKDSFQAYHIATQWHGNHVAPEEQEKDLSENVKDRVKGFVREFDGVKPLIMDLRRQTAELNEMLEPYYRE